MGKWRKGCHDPEVQKCLHCQKPDCDCADDAKPHVSELYALLCAGMIRPHSITRHWQQKGKKFGKGVTNHEQQTADK